MIFFKVIAYILLSIGVCTLVLAGIVAIVKKQMIIAHINLLLAMLFCASRKYRELQRKVQRLAARFFK
ncbi:hypothetical protein Q0N88_21510 [Bacillus thuringiensis]|uniref:hypothetical protein n=1 Tax=Bacillus thuringiensis TaxID=1428 RepID=UPI003457A170